MNNLPSFEQFIDNYDVTLYSDTYLQWTLNTQGNPSTKDRARIGDYYFVHLVQTDGETNLGYGAWPVTILDNCFEGALELSDLTWIETSN